MTVFLLIWACGMSLLSFLLWRELAEALQREVNHANLIRQEREREALDHYNAQMSARIPQVHTRMRN